MLQLYFLVLAAKVRFFVVIEKKRPDIFCMPDLSTFSLTFII